MKKIFSKVNNELLHIIYDTNLIENDRIDLIESKTSYNAHWLKILRSWI